ncbi:MAG: Stk1 family PASTA domain-containing Ser/Thr kinase [Clostridia bacterium]|nr:Stk1 family PASTA domain-containing Ser/Thr kinase [Clostridia bacterium]
MDSYVNKCLDNRYEIKDIIGVGGMAVVYKAYDKIDDRTVAVKILKDEFLANEEFRRRFKNESKAIAVLSHPNIVKVYDVSYGDRLQYIVMEYVEGITLKEYIEQQGVINQKEAVYFVMQILRALQHAHDKGIVHRDIKPQNIMLLENGMIKVTDFGIARFSRSETRTLSESTIGSVHYISPEQARGDVTDDKADLYSVGVMFYEMLTGKLPFTADSTVSVAIMQLQNDPEPPTKINPSIPVGLEQIIMHAMKKNINERYQSAAEMILDLEEFKRNPSVQFNYSYFVDNEPTRMISNAPAQSQKQPPVKIQDEEFEEDDDDEEEEIIKNRTIPVLIGIIVALIVGIVGAGFIMMQLGYLSLEDGFNFSKVKTPDFVGLNYYDEIVGRYDGKDGYTFEVSKVASDDAPADTVITQDPEAGTKIDKEKTIIKLTIAENSEQIQIPEGLEGQDYSYVISELDKLGFVVSPKKESNELYDAGKVIKINPRGGSLVMKGSTVVVTYNIGADEVIGKVTVKDVTGLKSADAKSLLTSLKLDVRVEEIYSDTVSKGVVIRQSLANSSQVDEGTTITIYVSKGADPSVDMLVRFRLPASFDYKSLEIKLNGKTVKKEDNVYMAGTPYSVSVKGSGTSDSLEVLMDGKKYYTCSVNFISQQTSNEKTYSVEEPTEAPTEPSTTTTTTLLNILNF